MSWYVYDLIDPRDGKTFYVGKGTKNRAYQHTKDARSGLPGAKCDRIREILALGLKVKTDIIEWFDTETEAYALERIRISNLSPQLTNSGCGGSVPVESLVRRAVVLMREIARLNGTVRLRQPVANSTDISDVCFSILNKISASIGIEGIRKEFKKYRIEFPEESLAYEEAS